MTEQPYGQPPLSDAAQTQARRAVDESAALAMLCPRGDTVHTHTLPPAGSSTGAFAR